MDPLVRCPVSDFSPNLTLTLTLTGHRMPETVSRRVDISNMGGWG